VASRGDRQVRRSGIRPCDQVETRGSPRLHSAQEIFGFLADDILVYVAQALKRPLSQVYGVATFYNFFRLKPAGKHTVVVCTGTACYVKGAAELQGALEKRCGCKFGETSKDGQVSLMQARCIGSCGLAPVAVLDEEVGAKLTPQKLLERVDAWLNPKSDEPRPSGDPAPSAPPKEVAP
jgi:bidirectional [NiFe] hydrogenase diaphorase subunit